MCAEFSFAIVTALGIAFALIIRSINKTFECTTSILEDHDKRIKELEDTATNERYVDDGR